MQQSPTRAERAGLYTPRILQQHLVDKPDGRWWTADGTVVFVDISGFTKLSERLARKGREGSEQITEVIGRSFESILAVAYDNGASLLKFGGDALLLWFQDAGHPTRACRAAVHMRRVLRDVGRIEVPGAKVTLRMSQGVHSGLFHFFAVGATHYEMLPVGPAWSRVVEMEHTATAGEILVSSQTVPLLPARCLGKPKGPGVLLAREPAGAAEKLPLVPRPKISPETLERCLPPAVRAHVLAGGGSSEHRPVTIAFIRYEGTDALIAQHGPDAAADALHRLVAAVDAAADEFGVALLASDVDADGGKLILTAGAPTVTGDDEERMLLALRRIVDAGVPIPIRIGVNRGAIFAGDIGPFYRRTYTVMGDAVNLAARLMAKAAPGHIYATADVLDRSNTLFATSALEPFMVKGKAQPIEAWSVGSATGSRTRLTSVQQLPLIGRDGELATLRAAIDAARAGSGRMVLITGEAGIGKTRLLEASRDATRDFRMLDATAEAYTASTPYIVWREILRGLLDIARDAPDAEVADRLRVEVTSRAPELLPWLPLLAIAFGVPIPPTPEVELLTEKNRRPKLHETIDRFLTTLLPGPTLLQVESAQHMDEASAELLAYLVTRLDGRPWLIAVTQRPGAGGLKAPNSPAVVTLALEALAQHDVRELAKIATEEHPLPMHVLDVVVERSGGSPQFLRDLLRLAIASGSAAGLPDSAEAAAIARIDALTPTDRETVRRASVLGMTFHPRMLGWFPDEQPDRPSPSLDRLHDVFEADDEGYLRFRRALIRDAAYEGLPFKLRRQLHRTVAQRLEAEAAQPDEVAGILSLHYFEAGEFAPAWRFAPIAARRAEAAFAYVEAAGLYARAIEAAKRVPDVPRAKLATTCGALGDAWLRATEYQKASAAFALARRLNAAADPVLESILLRNQSRVEEKLGQYPKALRWAARARRPLQERHDPEAMRQLARSNAWYATVLQFAGRPRDAIRFAEHAVEEAQPIGDHDALADAYLVIGWARGAQGLDGAARYWELALESAELAGRRSLRPALLINLGLACQWEGRWDEAIDYYQQGRDDSTRIGSHVNAMLARLNIADILIERGQWADASALLRETLPFFRAAKYRYFLGACMVLLGRVSLGMEQFDEAFDRLEESKRIFVEIGAADEIPGVEARIAQCLVYLGKPDDALALVDKLLARVSASKSTAKLTPMLQRIRALALYAKGDYAGARAAARAGLEAATSGRDGFETALAARAIIEIDRAAGVSVPAEDVARSEALLAKFRIHEMPRMPPLVATRAAAPT